MTRGRPRHDDILTPREWDVLALIREGLTNQQIADRLEISLNTAKYHVAAILAKLDVTTRHEAAAWRPDVAPRRRFAALAPLTWPLRHIPFGLAGKAAASAAAIATVAAFVLAISVLAQRDADSLGKIAYIQDGNVWVKTLPNGKPRQLTTDGDNSYPRWSRSGEWLVFEHGTLGPDSEGWVIHADGSDARRLDSPGYVSPQWSPIGDELLYLRADGAWVLEAADGSSSRVVSRPFFEPSGAGAMTPFWTRDGSFMYQEVRWPADAALPPVTPASFPPAPPPEQWSSIVLGHWMQMARVRS
jgi:DNA-binding CsgD family transcriptional regulator